MWLFVSESVSRDPVEDTQKHVNPFVIDIFHVSLQISALFHLAFCPLQLTCVNYISRTPVPVFLLDLVSGVPPQKIQGREDSEVGYLFPDRGWLGYLIDCKSMLLSDWLGLHDSVLPCSGSICLFCSLGLREGKNYCYYHLWFSSPATRV